MRKQKARSAPGGRVYRRSSSHVDERSFQVVVEESDLWITVRAAAPAHLPELALQRVRELRAQLKAWMLIEPDFAHSLEPVAVPVHAPEIVRRMCAATALMGVGPMAAVAGAVAALTAETLLPWSAECIVENGGDCMLHSTKDRLVGVLRAPSQGVELGLVLKAEDFPLSLCASSAVIGHSLSLGQGELAVVRGKDAFLADAAATALCNMLKKPEDLERATDFAASFADKGVDGVLLQCCGHIGIWGAMELAALE